MGPVAILARLPTILRARLRHGRRGRGGRARCASSSSTARSSRIRSPSASAGAAPTSPSSTTCRRACGPGGPGRARKMRDYVDHVLALLPFEPEAHERLGGPPCTYVGHPADRAPAVDRGARSRAAGRAPGLAADAPLLVVLPGSRPSEVERLMRPFGEALSAAASSAARKFEVVIPVVDSVRAPDRAASAGVAEAAASGRGRGGQVPRLQAGARGACRLRHGDARAGAGRHADGGRLQGRCA